MLVSSVEETSIRRVPPGRGKFARTSELAHYLRNSRSDFMYSRELFPWPLGCDSRHRSTRGQLIHVIDFWLSDLVFASGFRTSARRTVARAVRGFGVSRSMPSFVAGFGISAQLIAAWA
eukprot:10355715-Alexandrium_andersonii.AAC.1